MNLCMCGVRVDRLIEADAQLLCDQAQSRVRRPQPSVCHQRGREQVSVDPADATTVKAPLAHERDNFTMLNSWCLAHQLVVGEHSSPTAFVADEQFAEDEIMAADFALSQQSIEGSSVRRPIGQEVDPDRRVDEDHQAAECFDSEAFSRRRRTCVARGSLPRNARNRS